MPEPMPLARRVLYALGSTGWQITDRIVVSIAIFFYLPPEGQNLVPQVSEEIFFAGLTVFGAASLIGRVFDAAADPVVGFGSDRSRSRMGRRRAYMVYGTVPMVVLPALLFWPPGPPESLANAVWLAAIMSLYFIFFTVYVAPYLALMPEIAWDARDRVNLSTLMAIAGVPIAIFGFVWGAGIDVGVSAGLSAEDSIRAIVVVSSIFAFVLCLLPIAAVNEERFCHSRPSELRLWESLIETLRNRPFRRYLVAQLPFIVGVNMISPALIYYATVVLGRSPGYIAKIGGALFATTIIAFLPVNRHAQRVGPKRTIILCVAGLTVSTAMMGLLRPDVPGGPEDLRNLVLIYASMIVAGVALAGFITMPNVLIGQVVDVDTARTGANRAAMFFGVQGLTTKVLYGVSGAILAWLFSAYGKSADEPLGVLLVGPVAAGFCLVSTALFFRYPEDEAIAAAAGAVEASRSAGAKLE